MQERGYPIVEFQGERYLFIGTDDDLADGDGAIAEKSAFENGECSFAHLMADDRIMRFLKQIGTRSDLKHVGYSDAEITAAAPMNVLFGDWSEKPSC